MIKKHIIKNKLSTKCYVAVSFDEGSLVRFLIKPEHGLLSNKKGTTNITSKDITLGIEHPVKDFTHFYPKNCAETFSTHVFVELLKGDIWENHLTTIDYYDNDYQEYYRALLMRMHDVNVLQSRVKEARRTGCYSKMGATGKSQYIRFSEVLTHGKHGGILSNEQGTTLARVGIHHPIEDVLYFYPNECLDNFSHYHLPVQVLIKDRWVKSFLAINYNNADYKQNLVNNKVRTYRTISFIGMTCGITLIVSAVYKQSRMSQSDSRISQSNSLYIGITTFISFAFWLFNIDETDNSGKQEPEEPNSMEIEPRFKQTIDLVNPEKSTAYFSYDDDKESSGTSCINAEDATSFHHFNESCQASLRNKFVITMWSRPGATNDFEALLEMFDTNNDMIFDAKDDLYSDFHMWQDTNDNDVVDADELTQLAKAGIIAIHPNTSSDTATIEWADGHTTLAHDLTFQYEAIA